MILLDRKVLIQKRNQIQSLIREEKEKAIVETLKPFLKGNIGLYVPIKGEVDIFRPFKHLSVYLPVVISNTDMEFVKYEDNLQKGSFGVLEPVGTFIDKNLMDVIVVPMVGFNHTIRMGYGKGYYDRYLKDFCGLKIGVAFDIQEDISILKKAHDVEMDMIITETRRILKCE